MKNEENKKDILSLLDDPKDVPIDKLPAPKGASSDVKNVMKESPVNNKLYSYSDLSKKVQNMPVIPKVRTYFEKLDYFLDGGLQGGELMVMSGPSGNGKSLICQSMAYNQGANNIPSLWLTLEMGWQSTTRKFMAMDWEYKLMEKPSSLPIFYPIDNRALSLDWLKKQIFKAKRENGVEIVYLDHLHSLLSLMDMKGNTPLILGGIVKELHQIVIEADIPLVLIAHTKKLNVGDVPDINSIRDSGMIVCEADFMGILWRERDKSSINNEEVTENANVYTDRTFFSLEKNRRGRDDEGESTGRMFLGKANGKLCPYSEYLYLRDNKLGKEKDNEEKINTDEIL